MKENLIMLRHVIKKIIPGVTWQHPVIAAGLRFLDPIDWLVRYARGLGHLPKLSRRVRSNGLRGQFGGSKFVRTGSNLLGELKKYGKITPESNILEIGCGVGRNAFALSQFLESGTYSGIDIDKPSIEAAQSNNYLKKKNYSFSFLDVDNPEYNPNGKYKASDYVFEYEDEAFDLILLVSVFTHMLPRDIENYIGEISRMLKPGGHIIFTTFIMDFGIQFDSYKFEYGDWPWLSTHENLPEICVGYYKDYFEQILSERNLEMSADSPLASIFGGRDIGKNITTYISQDIVIAKKIITAEL